MAYTIFLKGPKKNKKRIKKSVKNPKFKKINCFKAIIPKPL